MEIVYLLLPISVLLGLAALVFYFWGVRSGQYDDLETPPRRLLIEDIAEPPSHGAGSSDSEHEG